MRDTAAPATQTVSGTITSVADDGSSFTLRSDDGRPLTFLARSDSGIESYSVGDSVDVSYVENINGTLSAQSVDS